MPTPRQGLNRPAESSAPHLRAHRLIACAAISIVASPIMAFAACEDSTNIWLSASPTASTFAEVPVFNTTGETPIYVWSRPADSESITHISLNLLSSTEISFVSGGLDNPILSDESRRRFEYLPDPVTTTDKIELQGFTLLNQEVTGEGIGPDSKVDDPLYNAATDIWRLGSLVVSVPAASELYLQVGENGIQGVDKNGDNTPFVGVTFGHATDDTQCAIDNRSESSPGFEGLVTQGALNTAVIPSVDGSYFQSSSASLIHRLRPASGDSEWQIRGEARLDGELLLSSTGYSDPTVPGSIDALTLLSAQSVIGQFDSVSLDGMELFDSFTSSGTVYDGNQIFRTLSYSDTDLELTNYRALPGDFNGDRMVNFPDFLILSQNFGGLGIWTDGDATGDGLVSFPDFLVLSQQFGSAVQGQTITSVPEPSSLAVVTLFFLFVFCICDERKKKQLVF